MSNIRFTLPAFFLILTVCHVYSQSPDNHILVPYQVMTGMKFAYYDSLGNMVTPEKYTSGIQFSEGRAVVYDDQNKAGFIDINGIEVIPTVFDAASNYSEGMAAAGIGEYGHRKYGYIGLTVNGS